MPSRDHIGHARTQPEVGRSVDGCPAGTRAPSRHRRALASGTVPGVRLEARRGGVERRFWPAIATPREQDAAPGLRERVDVRASGRRCGAANRPTLDGVSPPRTTGSHSDIDKTRRSQPAHSNGLTPQLAVSESVLTRAPGVAQVRYSLVNPRPCRRCHTAPTAAPSAMTPPIKMNQVSRVTTTPMDP